MKNKILVYILVGLVVVGAAAGIYFMSQQKSDSQLPKAEENNNPLATDEFSIMMPEGWLQAEAIEGISAMAVNAQEETVEPKAQEIGFKTYFAITKDTLQGKTMAEYLQMFKDEVAKIDTAAVFMQENEVVINGREARAVEIKMVQEGLNFRVLVMIVRGENEDLWTVTFNTLESNWSNYQETFSEVAQSFQLKIN